MAALPVYCRYPSSVCHDVTTTTRHADYSLYPINQVYTQYLHYSEAVQYHVKFNSAYCVANPD